MAVVRGRFGSYRVDEAVLSKGGVGAIHATGDPGLVYKRYLSPDKAPRVHALNRLLEIGRDVLVDGRRRPGDTPESSINWPVDVTVDPQDGGVTGVLLPTIPAGLFLPEYDKVRGLEFLIMRRASPPSAVHRIALLLRMAEILNYVDNRGLIHGDINGKNLAWTKDPAPVMYLIDCDGMMPQHPAPRTGVQAMGWTDPRVADRLVPAHDQYSDWYALALAMYRGLFLVAGNLARDGDGNWPEPSQIPDWFPPRLADLLRRGLSPLKELSRPTPGEWVSALKGVYLPRDDGRLDADAVARLDRHVWGDTQTKIVPVREPVVAPSPVIAPTPVTAPRAPVIGPRPPGRTPTTKFPAPAVAPRPAISAQLTGTWVSAGGLHRVLTLDPGGSYLLRAQSQPDQSGSYLLATNTLTLQGRGGQTFVWQRYGAKLVLQPSNGGNLVFNQAAGGQLPVLLGRWANADVPGKHLTLNSDGSYTVTQAGTTTNGMSSASASHLVLDSGRTRTEYRWSLNRGELVLTQRNFTVSRYRRDLLLPRILEANWNSVDVAGKVLQLQNRGRGAQAGGIYHLTAPGLVTSVGLCDVQADRLVLTSDRGAQTPYRWSVLGRMLSLVKADGSATRYQHG